MNEVGTLDASVIQVAHTCDFEPSSAASVESHTP